MKIYTTLNRIRQADPCSEGWTKLLTFLNKTSADDEPLDLLTILESNGAQDCLWAFQCTDDNESIYRHMSADFAESVLHIYEADYPNDNRPRLAIQAAREFADGKISAAARAASWAPASAAASDAASAASLAASAAAGAASLEAARAASWAARDARAAARAAARAVAMAASWAARAASLAASAAAWVASWAAWAASWAAWAASWAAWAAAMAAGAAAGDAGDAELEKQKAIIIKYLS